MAAMGRGKLSGKPGKTQKTGKQQQPAAPLAPGLNVVIPVGKIAPVMQRGGNLPVVGRPIMREGFVTDTGFLPSRESSI